MGMGGDLQALTRLRNGIRVLATESIGGSNSTNSSLLATNRQTASSVSATLAQIGNAIGTMVLVGAGTDGKVFTIDAKVFEFDGGDAASGTIGIAASNLSATNRVVLNDGTNPAVTLSCNDTTKATGAIAFSAVIPSDGDTFSITDGAGTAIVFECDNNGSWTAGRTPMFIKGTVTSMGTHAIDVINGTSLLLTATSGGAGIMTLTAKEGGTAYNVTIGKSGTNITKTNFSGGAAAAADAFLKGATNLRTCLYLTSAINADATLTLSATNGGAGTISLLNTTAGTAGNVTITKTGGAITVTGMAGGTAAGGGTVASGRIRIGLGTSAAYTMSNIVTAINSATTSAICVATQSGAACTLISTGTGTAYNKTITTDLTGLTVTGLAGATDKRYKIIAYWGGAADQDFITTITVGGAVKATSFGATSNSWGIQMGENGFVAAATDAVVVTTTPEASGDSVANILYELVDA